MTGINHSSIFDAEIVSLSELLSERHSIPDMQRPFEWLVGTGADHVGKLWDCLIEYDEDDPDQEDLYYTGTLICYKERGMWSVIDGQQRITTLSVMFIAMRDILAEAYTHHRSLTLKIEGKDIPMSRAANVLAKRTIGNSQHPRLSPKEDGSANTVAYLWLVNRMPRPAGTRGVHNPNAPYRINKAYRLFKKELEIRFPPKTSAGIEGMILFAEHILNGVVFNRTRVRDMAYGYRIFSNENIMGLKLNHMDITRALVMAQLDRKKLMGAKGQVTHSLKGMSNHMDSKSSSLKNHFIRTFWVVREGRPLPPTPLLNLMGKEIKLLDTEVKIKNFSRKLNSWCSTYRKSILEANIGMSHYRAHTDLTDCGFKQHYPLLLALLRRDNLPTTDEMSNLLGIVETIYVRYILVGNMRANVFEGLFAKWSKLALEYDSLDRLKRVMLGDIAQHATAPPQFKEAFAQLTPKPKVATYLLSKIERHKVPSLNPTSDFAEARALPVLPIFGLGHHYLSNGWKVWYTAQDYAKGYPNRIGNYALIQESSVPIPYNGEFDERKSAIVDNCRAFTHSKAGLEKLGTFHPYVIDARGDEVAEIAADVWDLDNFS